MDKYLLIVGKYITGESLGGGEKFIKRLYESIPSNCEKIVFIDFFIGYKLSNFKNKLFGKQLIIYKGNVRVEKLGVFPMIFLVLRKKIYSVLISGVEGYALIILLFLKLKKGINIFYIVHGIYKYELINDRNGKDPFNFKYKLLFTEHIIIKLANKIIYLSNATLKIMEKYFDISNKELILINNGTDDIFFFTREETNLLKPLRLVYVGGYGRLLKGFDYLIDSLKQTKIRLELVICGKIENEKEFFQKIKLLPAEINVKIKGMISSLELSQLYRNCDIFLLPSKFETFSIATLEAMASSLVPIVTVNVGAARYIENGKSGFIVNYDNSEELINTITMLNENRSLLKEISTTAQLEVKKLTWNELGKTYYNLLVN